VRRLAQDARARDGAAVALPSLLALVLCAIGITGRSLGFDEAATVAISSQHGSALWSAIARDGGNMSGFYLVEHLLIRGFGNGLLVIRAVGLLATVASVALVALIALRLSLGRRTAFAGATLAAVSLSLVFWGQNARGYAPMVAFVCGAFLAFVTLARPGGDGRRRHWVAYVLCMTCALYSSFVAVLVVPAQLILLLHRRRLLGRFVAALATVGVLCVPLVALAVHRGSSQLFWVPKPTRMLESQVLQSMASAGQLPSFHSLWVTTGLLLLTLVLFLTTVVVVIARRAAGSVGYEREWGGLLLVAWVMIPLLLAWLASFVIQPLFLPRNLMMSVPPVGLVLALGITDPRLPRLAAAGGLLLLVGLRAVPLVAAYDVSPEPWRQSTAYVLGRSRPGDCVAFYPEDSRMAFQYYVGTGAAAVDRSPRSILPVARWGQDHPFVEHYATLTRAQVAAARASCARLWFVSSHEGEPDGPPTSLANRARYTALRASLERAFDPAPIVKFGYASAIHVQLFTRR
jgi:Dolichyl-phosphate-mannose-protein mannosyltransferase